MFGHKCFLRIGQLNDSSISGLYRDSYELLSFNFSIGQETDSNGKVQTDVQGGTINFIFANVPTNEFIQWMKCSDKLEDGALIICDAEEYPLEKILFWDATCIELDIDFIEKGSGYITTKMSIEARVIKINNENLTKNWVNLGKESL